MRDVANHRLIVVGVDDSPASLNAARYAVDQAHVLHLGVRLLHAYGSQIGVGRYGGFSVDRVSRSAQRLMETVRAQLTVPDSVQVDSEVTGWTTVDALVHAGEEAQYVVVGQHAKRWGTNLVPGRVASRLSSKAGFPVVTVPTTWSSVQNAGRSVVVALDGRSPAQRPLGFAFHRAQAMRTALTVLHAVPLSCGGGGRRDDSRIPMALIEWRERYPRVPVTIRFVPGNADDVLADASINASLLVVGKPHEYPGFGMWIGSVGSAVLKRSACPIAVVPHTLADTRYALFDGGNETF